MSPRFPDLAAVLQSWADRVSTGELTIKSDQNVAKIYFCRGKILWAFASGQRESFQSILVENKFLPAPEIKSLVHKARRAGKKHLAPILRALGITDTATRREVIKRHSLSAFAAIQAWAEHDADFTEQDAKMAEGSELFDLSELFPHTKADFQTQAVRALEVLIGTDMKGLSALVTDFGAGLLLLNAGGGPVDYLEEHAGILSKLFAVSEEVESGATTRLSLVSANGSESHTWRRRKKLLVTVLSPTAVPAPILSALEARLSVVDASLEELS